ncbi:MAG: glycosyltransferase family 4 protein [bacterium]
MPFESMPMSLFEKLDIGALVPGVGVFGGVRRFIEMGNELVRRGHRYVLYSPSGEPPAWIPFSGESLPLSRLPRERHQVLICNDPPLLDDFERAAADLKLFYFVLENVKGERRIARHPGWRILANSSGMYNHLRRKYRIEPEKVVGGINLHRFKPADRPRTEDAPFRILTFGRISRRKKGVPIVLDAVKSFADRLARSHGHAPGRDVQLVLFDHIDPWNPQDPREDTEPRLGALPHEWHLNLSQEELAALYTSCHLFVSAEKRAGWANTVAEAMACGLPVVCTRSGARDIAEHRRSAWVVRWRHRYFVEAGIRALYRDPALADRLRANALQLIRRFSWPHVVDQLEDVIRRRLPHPPDAGA